MPSSQLSVHRKYAEEGGFVNWFVEEQEGHLQMCAGLRFVVEQHVPCHEEVDELVGEVELELELEVARSLLGYEVVMVSDSCHRQPSCSHSVVVGRLFLLEVDHPEIPEDGTLLVKVAGG